MKITKQDIVKSEQEILVELDQNDFRPHIDKAAEQISKEVKVDGFRAGKAPFDLLKQKVGEMAILEEAARIAINKTIEKALNELGEGRLIGQPKVDVVKLAPGNPFEYKIKVSLIPEITLGKYKELGIKGEEVPVDEAEIGKAIKQLREMKVKEVLVDREAKEGDKLLIDMRMFQDNVPLENGQAVDTAIIIGQENLIPGFDKQFIGLKKGDEKNFSLPYPENHYMQHIAGKIVDFKAKVKDVFERELPLEDDEMAKSFGLKSLTELKDNIRKSMQEEKKREADRRTEKKVIEQIMDKAKFGDLPPMIVEEESRNMIAELKQGISEQGGKFEDYLMSMKKTEMQLMLDMMPDAVKRVKASLLIREIAKIEEIKVKPEDVKHNIEHMKSHYKDNPDVLRRLDSREYYNYVVNVETSRMVVEKLLEWNVVSK